MDKNLLFEWKQRREIEEKKIRAKLEKAYEQEKSKVSKNTVSNKRIVSDNEEMQ